jgi:hypothetical protein
MLNSDFKEFAELLNTQGVDYLVVGGYALDAKQIRKGSVISMNVARP